jgi:hypothetical protein
MQLIQKPDLFEFSGNVPEIIVQSTNNVTIKLYDTDIGFSFEETYIPDADNLVKVDYTKLLSSLLKLKIPTVADYHQTEASLRIHVTIATLQSFSFTIVKGGVRDLSKTAEEFFKENFLTWQPQIKKIKATQPEWLSAFLVWSKIKLKAYFSDDTNQSVDLTDFVSIPGEMHTVDTSFQHVNSLFEKQVTYYDVWIENTAAQRSSYIQRFILSTEYHENEQFFICGNSLGGIDTIPMTGETKSKKNPKALVGKINGSEIEYGMDFSVTYTQNTGHIDSREKAAWLQDFFLSTQKNLLVDGVILPIVMDKNTIKDSTRNDLRDFSFDFRLSKQSKYQNLTRNMDVLPENLEIATGNNLFFLEPRLSEFPTLAISDTLTFPVMLRYTEKWGQVTFASLKAALINEIDPGDLSGYATEQWVIDKKYLTQHQSLDGYATQTWVESLGYTGDQDLTAYATQAWVQNQGYLTKHQDLSNYARKDQPNTYAAAQTINANLHVNGDIIHRGSSYTADFEQVQVQNNLMQLNVGEPGSQITGTIPGTSIPFSGIEINRGTPDSYYLGVVEGAKPLLKLGKKDSLEAIATRADNITDGYPIMWDAANKQMIGVAAVRDSLKLGGRNAADYWHKDNSNKFDVDWSAQILRAKCLNLGERTEGDLNTLPDSIGLNTFSTRLFGSGASNRPTNVSVSDGIIHTYNWNGSKYALQIAHDIDGTGSAFRHRSGDGNSWSDWSKYYTSLNANRIDVDWRAKDFIATAGAYTSKLSGNALTFNRDSSSYIDNPTGSSSSIIVRYDTNHKYAAIFGASTRLYHSGNLKFETTASGTKTTGTHIATTYFGSSTASAVLGTGSTGTVYIRPNSYNSSSKQSTFSTTLASIDTDTTINGYLGSLSYVSGFGGSGWRVDAAGNATLDKLTVRKTFNVYELNINKIRSGNGSYWFSDGAKVVNVTEDATYYFLFFDSETGNPFLAGDILRCQTWTGRGIKYYTGTVYTTNNSTGYFVSFYKSSFSGDVPEIGDEVVRIGNISNTSRQGAVYITSNDNDAPYIDVMDGVTSDDFTGKTKVRLGKLDGITDSELGNLTGYGLYSQNVFLKGKIVANSGKIANWNIEGNYIWGGTGYYNGSTTKGLDLYSDGGYSRVIAYKGGDYVNLYYSTDSDWGILGRKGSSNYFQLGSTNQIAGWTFTSTSLKSPITASGGYSLINAGDILVTADGNLSGSSGNYVSMFNHSTSSWGLIGRQSGSEVFRLGSVNKIAGCNFDYSHIWVGDKWRLNSDGSGFLAKNNISWDASGNVTFGSTVKLQWAQITNTENIETIQGSQAKIDEAINTTKATIDATSLDPNKYYPITIDLQSNDLTEITVMRTLTSSYGIPSYSTHSIGFSCLFKWSVTRSGWGTNIVKRTVTEATSRFHTGNVCGTIGQMYNYSKEYIYVRGGSKYDVIVKGAKNTPIVLRTSDYTSSTNTISAPIDTVIAPVVDLETKTNESQVTTITNNTLSTTNVLAQNLRVNAAKVEGKLTAATIDGDRITANTITADKLDANVLTAANINFDNATGTNMNITGLIKTNPDGAGGQIVMDGSNIYSPSRLLFINDDHPNNEHVQTWICSGKGGWLSKWEGADVSNDLGNQYLACPGYLTVSAQTQFYHDVQVSKKVTASVFQEGNDLLSDKYAYKSQLNYYALKTHSHNNYMSNDGGYMWLEYNSTNVNDYQTRVRVYKKGDVYVVSGFVTPKATSDTTFYKWLTLPVGFPHPANTYYAVATRNYYDGYVCALELRSDGHVYGRARHGTSNTSDSGWRFYFTIVYVTA